MKKILLIAALFGTYGIVQATTISPSSSSLLGAGKTISGNDAYSWGIAIAVPTGQEFTSAEIDFTSIDLTHANSSGTGYLYTDLLNTLTSGVKSVSDNDASGDYWATKYSGANITSLGTEFFKKVNTTLTWSYVLSGDALAALNTYVMANGGFTIGIDPDCTYTIGGIKFTYTLGPIPHTVPDDALTAFLVVVSLAGLELFRRKFIVAKIKA